MECLLPDLSIGRSTIDTMTFLGQKPLGTQYCNNK